MPLSFSPDDQRIVTVSDNDNSIRLWDGAKGEWWGGWDDAAVESHWKLFAGDETVAPL